MAQVMWKTHKYHVICEHSNVLPNQNDLDHTGWVSLPRNFYSKLCGSLPIGHRILVVSGCGGAGEQALRWQ